MEFSVALPSIRVHRKLTFLLLTANYKFLFLLRSWFVLHIVVFACGLSFPSPHPLGLCLANMTSLLLRVPFDISACVPSLNEGLM